MKAQSFHPGMQTVDRLPAHFVNDVATQYCIVKNVYLGPFSSVLNLKSLFHSMAQLLKFVY
jgi:hypothetical protein